MAKAPPCFDFYYNDWIGGTRHLSLEEKACYLELLIYQWQNGHIPREPLQRMELCGITDVGSWERIWRHLEDKFECLGTHENTPLLGNARMDADRDKCIRRWKSNVENGKKGGRPKSKPNGSISVNPNKTISEGGRGKDLRKKKTVFDPPTSKEVRGFCDEFDLEVDADEFVDFYQQAGWKLANGNPMKDWRAAVRNWNRRKQRNTLDNDSRIVYD